jgi:hypothetical protein
MRSWFAGFLRSREIAEIDRAIQGAGDNGGSGGDAPAGEEAGGSSRPLGPLQVGDAFVIMESALYQAGMPWHMTSNGMSFVCG